MTHHITGELLAPAELLHAQNREDEHEDGQQQEEVL
jgi:hypothetical protein